MSSEKSPASAGERAAPAARRGGPPTSLEGLRNVVTEEGPREFALIPCGCDCWYCGRCCGGKAYTLRARLVPILAKFQSLMMLTLTVDPELFESPLDEYMYLRRRRAISRTMQDLRRWGCLNGPHYFYVVEFHKNEHPHFHVVCDSSYIPVPLLMKAWGKHRPRIAGPVAPRRPAFGYCWISGKRLYGALHVARYATKYLVKVPEHGFPSWVLAMGKDHRVPRFQTSRGFWGAPSFPTLPPARGESERTRTARSYADRLADCGSSLNVFKGV